MYVLLWLVQCIQADYLETYKPRCTGRPFATRLKLAIVHLFAMETDSTPFSPVLNALPLTTPSVVTISQEHVSDTVKHHEPLCPFAAEPFEGDLIVSEGRMQLLE
jgi:hypothetical protein